MFSGEGEEVPFVTPVNPMGKGVEFWLGDVEEEMKNTVKDVMRRANADYYTASRGDWVKKWPGQAVPTAHRITPNINNINRLSTASGQHQDSITPSHSLGAGGLAGLLHARG